AQGDPDRDSFRDGTRRAGSVRLDVLLQAIKLPQAGEEHTSFGKVHFLALTLGWSRYLWCGYGFQQDLLTLLHQLEQGLVNSGRNMDIIAGRKSVTRADLHTKYSLLQRRIPIMLRQEDTMSIEELHQQGMNHTTIAAKLGIHRQTVSRTLQRKDRGAGLRSDQASPRL
ncbi:MAG: helix-turn-helix domain-containing protein, partial [Deltaproteobacteria bacterium]